MKIDKKLKHASHTTIFSSLRQVISGFTSGHGSAPGSCKKITRTSAPICGAAIPRPYPVLARQCAKVSARSATSARISAERGSATGRATTRNPGSPNCKTVRTATSPPPIRARPTLNLLRFLPSPRRRRPKHCVNHRHVPNRILDRNRHIALSAYRTRKFIPLNRILIASRKLLHFRFSAHHIADKNPARPVVRRIPRNLDLHASRRPQKMHALIERRLRPAAKHRLPSRRKFQNRRRQPVSPKIRIPLQRAHYPHRLLPKNKSRHGDRIAANIQQPAPAPFHLVPHIRGIAIEVAEQAHRRPQLPDRSAANNLPRAQPLRMRLHHERLAHLHTCALARRQQRPRLRHVQADRLLAQHVLPCLRRFDRPRHVQMIRQRVVDRLHLAIPQQFLIRSVRLLNPQLSRCLFRFLLIPRSNRGDLAPRPELHPGNHFAHRNRRRPQDTPFHLLHSLLRPALVCVLCGLFSRGTGSKPLGPSSLHH